MNDAIMTTSTSCLLSYQQLGESWKATETSNQKDNLPLTQICKELRAASSLDLASSALSYILRLRAGHFFVHCRG